jgi:hypothetical protein
MATKKVTGIRGWIPLLAVFGCVALFVFGMTIFERTQSGEGSRSGVVVKLSKKGRISKSWEGELMLGGVQSGQTWAFSLDPADPASAELAKSLEAAVNSATPLTLRYHQRFIGPWSTDTNYLVFE